MSRRDRSDYEYIKADMIRRASDGDCDALDAVIRRYTNYIKTYIRNIGVRRYELEIGEIPIDDLVQLVNTRLCVLIVKRFDCNR